MAELQEEVEQLLPHLRSQFELLNTHFGTLNGAELTWGRWVWANSACTSRFCKRSEDQVSGCGVHDAATAVGTRDGVLVPIIDMLNHDVEMCNVQYIPPGPKAAAAIAACKTAHENLPDSAHPLELGVLVLTCAVKPGDELFYCYGEKGNNDLVRSYGFAQFDNMYDSVQLVIDVEHILGRSIEECSTDPERQQRILAEFNDATGSKNGQIIIDLTHSALLPAEAVAGALACNLAAELAEAEPGTERELFAKLPSERTYADPDEELQDLDAAKELLHELLVAKGNQLMHINDAPDEGDDDDENDAAAGLSFESVDEWESYVEEIKQKTSVVVGERVYATSAEGCAVASRSSQLLIVMGAVHELESEMDCEGNDEGDEELSDEE